MSLLRDIQESAASGEVRVADLLRKCRILAARLHSKDLAEWVERELNGYPEEEELPPYRIAPAQAKGEFIGAFGKGFTNMPIPIFDLPKKLQEFATEAKLVSGIATYEDLVFSPTKDGTFKFVWPTAALQVYGAKMLPGYQCVTAWSEVSLLRAVQLIDTVRTRVVTFALEIEALDPEAGEAYPGSDAVPAAVESSVQNIFYGDGHSIAVSSRDFTQTAIARKTVVQDIDFVQMARELPQLRASMVQDAKKPEHFRAVADVREAETAINSDSEKALGSLKRAGKWAFEIATKIGTTVTAEYLKGTLPGHH